VNRSVELACALWLLAAPCAAQVTTCNGANSSLAFGAYDGFATAPHDTQANILVTCTRSGGPPTTPIAVALGPSVNSGAIAIRRLKQVSGSDVLDYNLFRDATRVSIWGNTTGVDTVVQSITLANSTTGSIAFTVFGRIFALQDVRVGAYNDALLITVTY
jgi:spore coat protein U-like protein